MKNEDRDAKKAMAAELNRIAKKRGGKITPRDIVAAARDEDSPLHDYFEWDDGAAAELYRESQARTLLRSVTFRVTTTTEKFNVPSYIRDPEAESKKQGYVQTVKLKSDDDLAREALLDEFGRVAANLRRARAFAAYFGLVEDVDSMIDRLGLMRDRIEGRQEGRLDG